MEKKLILKLKTFFEKNLFSFPAYLICIFLLFPFFVFSFHLKSLDWPRETSFFSIFFMTLVQAGLSAFLSLILGLLGSRGLLSIAHKKGYFILEGLVLLPCLIPPLLLVLSLLNWIEHIIPFPFGFSMLIFSQTLVYTGLCAVAFTRIFLKEVSFLSEWAYLQGSSSWLFLKTLVKTVLKKDLKILFVLIFVSCFTSLSMPLLTAGGSFFSLEFFIYEKLKDPQLWPQALSLVFFQSLFVFYICWKVFSTHLPSDLQFSFKKVYLLPHYFFFLIPFGAVVLSLGGLLFISDWSVFLRIFSFKSILFSASLNSLILSFGVGALTLFSLFCMSFSFQNRKARKFVVSFMPPGFSFVGFAFLLWPFYGKGIVLIKWIFGLSLLFFPWVYRFRGERALEQLSDQVETARFLGASWWLVFRQILWPQSRGVFFLCAGLSSFWACGDFAYSLIVSGGHWNLSLLIYDFFSSYRFDEAILLSWLLLFLSFFVLLFWLGVALVFDKKLGL